MANRLAEHGHGPSTKGRKSMIVTIGNIPSNLLRKYEGQNIPPLSNRLRKRKSAPRKDGKPRRTKLGRPRKASIQAEREAEQTRQAAEVEAISRAQHASPLPASQPAQVRSPLPHEPGFEEDFIILSDHTIPLEMGMTYAGAMKHIAHETFRHLQLNIREKAQLEQQLAGIDSETERADPSGSQLATSQAPVVQPATGITQPKPDNYGVPIFSNPNHNTLAPNSQANSSRHVSHATGPQGIDITTLPISAFSSLPPDTRFDRLVGVYQTETPIDWRHARTGYFDTSTSGWHYDTTIRDNVFQNSLYGNAQSQGQMLDHSQFGLNLMRMNNVHSIDPRLFLQGGLGQTQPHFSSHGQFRQNNSAAPVIDQEGYAHIGFGTSHHSGVRINMTEVDATLAASPSPDSSATFIGSAQPIPPQTLDDFHQDRLLSSARIAQRNMSNSRRGRAKFRKMVSQHCEQEYKARDTSRGRYVEDDGTNGAFQVLQSDENGGKVLKTLPSLGFRREKLDYVEGEHWKTAEEWAAQVSRSFGAANFAADAVGAIGSGGFHGPLDDAYDVETASEVGEGDVEGTAFGEAIDALAFGNVDV